MKPPTAISIKRNSMRAYRCTRLDTASLIGQYPARETAAVLTMILASLDSPFPSWVLPVACGGGILVFAGLWMEKSADKKWFRDMPDLKRQKLKAKWGWRILMLGIMIETGTAGVLAIMEQQELAKTRAIEANIDPHNVRVSKIVGLAFVIVRPPFKTFAANLKLRQVPNNVWVPLYDESDRNKGEATLFDFGTSANDDFNSEIHHLAAMQSMAEVEPISITNRGNIRFDFALPEELVGNPKDLTYNQVKYVGFSIMPVFPGPPVEVITGRVNLTINGFLPKTLFIHAQTNSANCTMSALGE